MIFAMGRMIFAKQKITEWNDFFILSLAHAENDIYNNIFLRKVILFRFFL